MSKSRQRSTVDSLLADRARFEAWLDQLAAKAGQVPAHVAARVKADYEVRLNQVLEELRSRADELLAESATFEARIAELDTELTAKRDARAEDELRALVGEYGEGEWEDKRVQHDSAIASLESARESSAADLAHVRELLSQATRPSHALDVADTADIPEEPTPVTPPEPVATVEAPAATDAPLLDGLGVLPAVAPAHAPEPPPASPEPSKPPRRPTPFDEIAFLKTVVGRNDAATTQARASIPSFEPPPLPEGPDAATTVPRATPARLEPAPSAPAADPAAPPRVSSSAGDGARSLKCQECGWMNYPTEWYCEKCGGELAAF